MSKFTLFLLLSLTCLTTGCITFDQKSESVTFHQLSGPRPRGPAELAAQGLDVRLHGGKAGARGRGRHLGRGLGGHARRLGQRAGREDHRRRPARARVLCGRARGRAARRRLPAALALGVGDVAARRLGR